MQSMLNNKYGKMGTRRMKTKIIFRFMLLILKYIKYEVEGYRTQHRYYLLNEIRKEIESLEKELQ